MTSDGAANGQGGFTEVDALRALVDCVDDHALCVLTPDGAVSHWSGAAARVLGYAGDEVLGRDFGLFHVPEELAADAPARLLERTRRLGLVQAEGWRRRKEGGRFWASVTMKALPGHGGQLAGFAYTIRDITERQVAQDALRDAERQFRLLVDGVTDHALYVLDPQGIVVSWNAGAERIKGYSAAEAIGQHYSRFYTEVDRAAGLPAQVLDKAVAEGRLETEGWRVRKDGGLFWAQAVIHAIRDPAGDLIGFAKITRDVTEQRQAQLELVKTQERLFHAQKLEAVGQLTGGIAHDFNNLLMVIAGQVQVLKRATEPERASRAADLIERAADRGSTLTRQLLSFARRQHLSRAVIDVPDRIDGFRDILAKALGSNVQLTVDLPAGLWPIDVDPNEFELALMNLAVNARDAMPTGGAFTITGENVLMQPGQIADDLAGEYVALKLSDTGVGVPEDILGRVFEPFFTTKQGERGTGLGLSQVYGFARQVGGAATIESALGKGTSLILYLPRAAVSARAEQNLPNTGAPSGGSALLVEDNPDVAEVTAALLEQMGFRVTVRQNAEDALHMLDSGQRFDVIVSDVVMAGAFDGLALAERVRATAPDQPLLLVSGYGKAFHEAGDAFPILQKPFKIGDLQRAVSRVIAAARATPEPAKVVRLADVRRS